MRAGLLHPAVTRRRCLPPPAAPRAFPVIDDLVGRICRSAGSNDGAAAAASIRPLRRRAAQIVAHESGGQALLEIATEMNWIDDRVHIAAPDLRREREHVSQSLTPTSTISDDVYIVGAAPGGQLDCIWPRAGGGIRNRSSPIPDPWAVEKQYRQNGASLSFDSAQQQSP